ncbi:polymer-forming cytoskeletal protein [Alishewanella sp. 16-MA]|uniref:Polymer-forming cytoskeletal protein n=2 Tax=Pseudomonadota TaxID=1224 RepID=A0ABS8BZK4_9ALTE|nr:polymer-forming cytoskeletal protein [Alishewanella maricola]MCC5451431.1 polymer-forming cytoskeletal protein [Rheinheimera sp. UJ51]
MGFFGNHVANQGKHTITTVIAEGCVLNGNCRVNSDMQIDGELEGNVECKSTVIISCSGKVVGEITADKVMINGYFDGQITANIVEILPQGKAHGVVFSDNLCIERGGSFFGETHASKPGQQNLLLTDELQPNNVAELSQAK